MDFVVSHRQLLMKKLSRAIHLHAALLIIQNSHWGVRYKWRFLNFHIFPSTLFALHKQLQFFHHASMKKCKKMRKQTWSISQWWFFYFFLCCEFSSLDKFPSKWFLMNSLCVDDMQLSLFCSFLCISHARISYSSWEMVMHRQTFEVLALFTLHSPLSLRNKEICIKKRL